MAPTLIPKLPAQCLHGLGLNTEGNVALQTSTALHLLELRLLRCHSCQQVPEPGAEEDTGVHKEPGAASVLEAPVMTPTGVVFFFPQGHRCDRSASPKTLLCNVPNLRLAVKAFLLHAAHA